MNPFPSAGTHFLGSSQRKSFHFHRQMTLFPSAGSHRLIRRSFSSRWIHFHRLENDFLVLEELIIGWEMTFQPTKWIHRLGNHFIIAQKVISLPENDLQPLENHFAKDQIHRLPENDFLADESISSAGKSFPSR